MKIKIKLIINVSVFFLIILGSFCFSQNAMAITYTLGTATSQTITVHNNFTTTDNGMAFTATAATYNPNISVTGNVIVDSDVTFINTDDTGKTLNIDGDLIINSSGAFTAPAGTGATAFTLAGDFANSGTFTHNSGTMTFDGAGGSVQGICGSSTFYNFTATASSARTLLFASNSTQTISGTWNIAGDSANLTLGEASTPSQVTGLSAIPDNTQITLNWSAVADNGCPVTSYKVYRSSPTNGSYSLLTSGGCSSLGNILTCTDTGLTNDTIYYYKVSAVNAEGEGLQSDEVSATPLCTIAIGTQTWSCDNMNVGTRVDGSAEQNQDSTVEKYCYSDTEANCTTDGGLYQWAEIMQLPYSCNTTDCSGSINSPHQGICPSGYHIPTDTEWTTLTDYLSANSEYWCNSNSTWIAKSLSSTTGWTVNATTCAVGNTQSTNNDSGLTALPAGYRHTNGLFYNRGNVDSLWSASQSSATNSWSRDLYYSNATVDRYGTDKAYGLSVRCLKD